MGQPPVSTSSNLISTLPQRFACARLSRPCLPGSRPDFSATLTTTAFDRSSSRWLGISDLISEPAGPSLHLQYSYAAPCGPALLVTQDPFETLPQMDRCMA